MNNLSTGSRCGSSQRRSARLTALNINCMNVEIIILICLCSALVKLPCDNMRKGQQGIKQGSSPVAVMTRRRLTKSSGICFHVRSNATFPSPGTMVVPNPGTPVPQSGGKPTKKLIEIGQAGEQSRAYRKYSKHYEGATLWERLDGLDRQ